MQRYLLSSRDIVSARDSVEAFLTKYKLDETEILRLCVTLEEVLVNYQQRFGEAQTFLLKQGRRFGHNEIIVQLSSESFDPFENETDGDMQLLRRLQSVTDSSVDWSYKNGINTVSFVLKRRKKLSSSARTLIALLLAVVAGVLCGNLGIGVRQTLLDEFVSPTLNVIMGVITAVAGPMIFLSLLWGICTIGDTNTLSKIGKRMISRFFLELILIAVCISLLCWPFFKGSSGSSTAFSISEFYQMILGIVPNNMIAPFTTGNTQQIIFLAITGGIVLLMLGSRVSSVTNLVEHLTTFIQTVMTMANALVPLMIFLSIFRLILSGQLSAISQSYKIVPIIIGLSLLILMIYTAVVAIRHRVSPLLLMKKSAPAFLLALTTASSSTALSANLDICKNRFGIDNRLVRFGVPLGQTLFKPGALLDFVTICFCMAEIYGVAISPNWITVLILSCFLMCISSPPVPGGGLICISILFRQLGIPEEAVGFALTLEMLFDFIATAISIYCLQMELIGLSGSLNMLNEDKLRESIPA